MAGIKPPKPLIVNSERDMATEWSEWKELYENYFVAAKINKEEEPVQVANFINCAGREILKIINNLKITADERKKFEVLKTKLTEYFVPKKNKTFERCQFHRLKQQPSEPIEDFIQKLKTQVRRSGFREDDRDEFICDQIVLGIHSEKTRQKLWVEDELTLEKAIRICKAAEDAEKQMSEIQAGGSTGVSVNEIHRYKK